MSEFTLPRLTRRWTHGTAAAAAPCTTMQSKPASRQHPKPMPAYTPTISARVLQDLRTEDAIDAELFAIRAKLLLPLPATDWSAKLAAGWPAIEQHVVRQIDAKLVAAPTRDLDQIHNSWVFGVHMLTQPQLSGLQEVDDELVDAYALLIDISAGDLVFGGESL